MSAALSRPAYILAGATAAGKTGLAHAIARTEGWPILSADAMLVYRGMDIGTAKPTTAERAGLVYGGIDCVTPDQTFSVGVYWEHAKRFLTGLPAGQPVLVVGGTGLYIKTLLLGLDPMPPVDAAVRAEVQDLYEKEGLAGVQRACQEADGAGYAAVKDPTNPRRVMRALELARMGVPVRRTWAEGQVSGCVVDVQWERSALYRRIEQRVAHMYDAGLLDEVAGLRRRYPVWLETARQAIGYREAVAVLDGRLTEAEAQQETTRRTKQYARRQATWFRHQLPVAPVRRTEPETEDEVVARIRAEWSTHGPSIINYG